MKDTAWTEEFPAAITVCDAEGIILSMNRRAAEVFASDGGTKLIGSNVLDCHPEPSRGMLLEMLREGKSHTYTIKSRGVRKIITQQPWFTEGRFAGIVELSFELPENMPHHDRDAV
jgi:PAS domain S-box-containing protein